MKITCDKFPEGSRKRAICDGTIDWPLDKINAFRKQLGSEPLAEKPESTYVLQPARRVKTVTKPMSGHSRPDSTSSIPRAKQPGSRLKEEFAKWNAEECPICSGLAHQMDVGGPQYCRDNLDKIVSDILTRGKVWFATNYPKSNSLFVLSKSEIVRDLVMKLQIKKMVIKAISDTENEEAELKKKAPIRRKRSGCGCG